RRRGSPNVRYSGHAARQQVRIGASSSSRRRGLTGATEDEVALDIEDEPGKALLDGLLPGVEYEFRRRRRFIGGGDAGELGDLAGARLAVEALGVARLADGERRGDVDFVEEIRMRGADPLAIGEVWRDEGGDDDEARAGHQCGDFADATDVLDAVRRREAEIGIEAIAHIVAIEHGHLVALAEEDAFELDGERRLPGAGETGQPDNAAAVPVEVPAIGKRHPICDGREVLRFDRAFDTLIGITLQRDDAPADDRMVLDQDEPSGARTGGELVEGDEAARPQHNLADRIALDRFGRTF